ncbi:MAG: hypothetical protein EOO68_26040, partial [Moraxellaceae bacterium]
MKLKLQLQHVQLVFCALLLLIASGVSAQTTLAGWTFDSTVANPNTPKTVLANVGTQVNAAELYANGTNGSSNWIAATELDAFAGALTNDPRTTPSAGLSYSLLGGTSNAANGKAIVLKFSMTGFENPVLTFVTRGTSSGFATHQWAYSVDGLTFTNFGTNTANTGSTFTLRTLDLSAINAVDNASALYLRLTVSGATSASGNNRLDNFVVKATGLKSITPSVTSIADFGTVNVGSSSASTQFTVSAANLTANVVVASTSDFQVSLDNSTWSTTASIPFGTGTLTNVPVWARFHPQTAGVKTASITLNSTGATEKTVGVSGTATATSPYLQVSPTSLTFGSQCDNVASAAKSFDLFGFNLTSANVTVGPLTGYSFSTTANGTYSPSLSLSAVNGELAEQIFVKFTPTAVQSYNGNIAVAGGGVATTSNVAVTGAGINTPATVTASAATGIT